MSLRPTRFSSCQICARRSAASTAVDPPPITLPSRATVQKYKVMVVKPIHTALPYIDVLYTLAGDYLFVWGTSLGFPCKSVIEAIGDLPRRSEHPMRLKIVSHKFRLSEALPNRGTAGAVRLRPLCRRSQHSSDLAG